MGLAADAVRGERRVRGGHVDDLDARRAEHVRGVRSEVDRALTGVTRGHLLLRAVRAQARPLGDVDGLVGTDLDVECGIRGVDRGLRRLEQRDGTVARAAEVAHLPRGAVVVQRRRAARVPVAQPHAVLEAGDERERLERRTCLGVALCRGVERLVEVVLAAVEGLDAAGLRVDRDETCLQALRLVLRQLLDGCLGVLHPLLVEGRDDVVAAAVELGLVDAELGHGLLADVLPHVALLAAEGVLLARRLDLGHLHLVGLLLGDEALVDHRLDDVLEAILVRARILGGIGGAGTLDHRGEQCGLAEVEVLRGLAEVVLAGDLDTVGAASEVDRVEVVREDLVLALLLVDLERDEHLLDLAVEGVLVREVEVLHVLLGDRRPAAGVLVGGHTDHGARETLERDAAVLVERGVLGGDRRLLHRLGDLTDVDGLAVLDLVVPDRRLAVGVVDRRGLTGRLEVRFGNLGRRIADRERDAAEDDDAQSAHDEDAQTRQEARPSAHSRTRVVEQILRLPAFGHGCFLCLSHPRSSRSSPRLALH